METISLIIPVYNVEKYLSECLESVLAQTYKKLEIIIVDDGSTDDSLSICKEFKKRDKRIRLITQKNGGLSSARNTGLKNVSGDYIGFVDSDDFIHPKMYEFLYKTINDQNADIAECLVEEVFDYIEPPTKPKGSGEIFSMEGKEALKKQMDGNSICSPKFAVWSKLFKKETIKSLSFPKGMIHEDHLYDAQAFLNCRTFAYLNVALYYHRNRENSITTSAFCERDLDKLTLIKLRTEFLEKRGLNDLVISSKKQYFVILLLYFQETYHTSFAELNNAFKKELIQNKKMINSFVFDKKRSFDFRLFFFNPSLFIAWFKIKSFFVKRVHKKI